MKSVFAFVVLLISNVCFSQNVEIQKHKIDYNGVTSYYLIFSKKGEEDKKKPLFVFCQGSLARPLLIKSKEGEGTLLPFNIQDVVEKYHLVMVNKPALPLIEDVEHLTSNYDIKNPPKAYFKNNNLSFYYKRNNFLIRKLSKQEWVDKDKIVVGGHSEGSYIALEMAVHLKKITHLIYSGGNPLGRMMSIMNQNRMSPKEKENWSEQALGYWRKVINHQGEKETYEEDTKRYTYGLSQNFIPKLLKLKIPVLVTYGTKGQNGIFNDYLHVEAIKNKKTNFTFIPYFNCDHNFFPVDEKGQPDYKVLNWKKVVINWLTWLE